MSKRITPSIETYIKGEHNVMCAICGAKKKKSETALNDRGFLVCKNEIEKSIDTTRPRTLDKIQTVKNSRPDNIQSYINGGQWQTICLYWEDIGTSWQAIDADYDYT